MSIYDKYYRCPVSRDGLTYYDVFYKFFEDGYMKFYNTRTKKWDTIYTSYGDTTVSSRFQEVTEEDFNAYLLMRELVP